MGEVFAGRYELVDPIGRGGAGAVWRAWDHRRRRYVAAKVLQQSDAHTLLRFVREQALRIDHPHVLAPASWAADDDQVLFTMDLVAGGSLAHVIGDYGALPPRYVCTLLDQLLSGLATVHAEGVVHRDIKPANILMEATGTGQPHLRLSDFGISMRKGEPRLTETNYVVGTPGYFAPEQLLGAEPDFTADLYAVGLVALYLLHGTRPDSQALVEHFLAHGTPPAPASVPEPLWQVIAGLLQPDPQVRFRTATGVRKALSAAVELLPETEDGEEPVEIFDQLGPLPEGFGPDGPVARPAQDARRPAQDAPRPVQDAPQAPPAPVAAPAAVPPVQAPRAYEGQGQNPYQQYAPVPSPSETGSFHLPPPVAHPAPSFDSPAPQAPVPPHGSHAPAHPYPARTAGVPGTVPGTPLGSPLTSPLASPPTAPLASAFAPEPAPERRPGPPPKVAVPVLLLALVSLAVGFWALTQV
ncbi:protein kinase [Streptomyces filamentosus]|uniref:serine/threonine-protein kinase n=1 Tax=Streptomyces filamentosus TaxID=67294 RepID=UPI0036E297F5